MCGIFGVIGNGESIYALNEFERFADFLERRGHDAFGFAYLNNDSSSVEYGKIPLTYSKAKNCPGYKVFKKKVAASSFCNSFIFGHTRLATHGGVDDSNSNQPVVSGDWITVHNGIIINETELKLKYSNKESKPMFLLDTYAALNFMNSVVSKKEKVFNLEIIKEFGRNVKGANNFALYSLSFNLSILCSSNGSLFLKEKDDLYFFSSERCALGDTDEIQQIKFPNVFIFDHTLGKGQLLDLDKLETCLVYKKEIGERKFLEITEIVKSLNPPKTELCNLKNILDKNFQEVKRNTSYLTRCRICLLPETFPGISFNIDKVCNVCTNYNPVSYKGGINELDLKLKNLKNNKVLVSLSGGRDSCYTLHKVVQELGYNAIAFTYDWGMVTDLARRNQSRICGELGVEHIIVSADINMKRKNIRKNVIAWLENPSLGTVPIFMAGDKHYFYYAEKIKNENELELNIMGENQLEKTGFKSGFAGVEQSGEKSSMAYGVTRSNKFKLLMYYGAQFIKNPKFLNASLLDSFTGYLSYYIYPRSYINIFDYMPWNELDVEDVLAKYNWEYSPDCSTSWRIGDGTAPFYNTIYYTAVGFTEHDTLRANQIREGHLSTEMAQMLIERDNQPRAESFAWYCNTLGLDPVEVANKIFKIPKYYSVG